MATDDEPAWLSAWRGADAGRQPAQPAAQQRSQGAGRGSGTSSAASTTAAAAQRGIMEPQPWRFDQCQRREPVRDHDYWPPRVVRRVGWNLCLRCVKPFFSEDVARLRMCNRCKGLTQEKPIGD